ncbi:MAG: 6-phosphofructokinase [Clostridia bacterium]|nr:6-phosphofructokinase [Clostridia bacterium]
MKIGILTSGGDCSGLNPVIRAIGLSAYNTIKGVEIYGIHNGYAGLVAGDFCKMRKKEFDGLLMEGGTVLGSIRTPFKTVQDPYKEDQSKLDLMLANYKKLGLDCLFCLGGAGTHRNADLLAQNGCNVIGVPKTIDNDVYGTDVTFGFTTAVDVAADAMQRLRTTSSSHHRVMVCEVMGNKVGWLTIHSGLAAGADIILIPEIPFNLDAITKYIKKEMGEGDKRSVLIAIAEGAILDSEANVKKGQREFARKELGEITVTKHLAEELQARTGIETRSDVLGYIQRGGTPCAYDRVLCTRYGEYAVRLAAAGVYGVTVALKGTEITYNKLSDIAGKYKKVDPDGDLVKGAKNIGVSFGTKK